MEACQAHNLKVGGPNPSPATNLNYPLWRLMLMFECADEQRLLFLDQNMAAIELGRVID